MVQPFDYTELVADADEIIAEFGRQVTFIKTTSVPRDSSRPWRGPSVSNDTVLNDRWAAVVPYTSDDDKDAVRAGVKMVIVSASQFPDDDGELFDKMTDSDGSTWDLHNAQVINPGSVRVLYIFRTEQ